MIIYRGRTLDISEELKSKYEMVMHEPLCELVMDVYVSAAFKIYACDATEFNKIGDSELTEKIISFMNDEMSLRM